MACVPEARGIPHPPIPDEPVTDQPNQTNWTEYNARYAAAASQRLTALCQQINSAELCARASHVRGANASGNPVACTVDLAPARLAARMGGQNCHAEVVFADGVVWLARFRLAGPGAPPPAVRDYVLRSEAATMGFLQRHIRVPAPRGRLCVRLWRHICG